jgi:hypothetical protein
MNRTGAASLLAVFGLFSITAQVSAQVSSQPTVLLAAPISTDCPVGIRAQPSATGGRIDVVVDTKVPEAAGTPGVVQMRPTVTRVSQRLHFLFLLKNSGALGITGLEMTVHGTTAEGRVLPVASASGERGTIARKLSLKVTMAAGADTTKDVAFNGFTSMQLIDLDSVSYADGTSWHPSVGHTCSVEPSHLLLVGGR